MSVLFYRRPDYVSQASGPMTSSTCQRYIERAGSRTAIPRGLSFESVLTGKTMPPCSLGDFMDYLTYIQHNAENLQFYLWLWDYKRRFAEKRLQDQALSPEWKSEPSLSSRTPVRGSRGSLAVRADPVADEVEYAEPSPDIPSSGIPFTTIPTLAPSRTAGGVASRASLTRNQGLKPTTQPFRAEIDKVVAHYIAIGSPRELNISARDRAKVISALQHTTHPSALALIGDVVDVTLRSHSHPNFIRWSICNGNKPYVFFVRSVGIICIVLSIIMMVLLTLSQASRWWRIAATPQLLFGIATIVAGYKGLCLILHAKGIRNVRPWEQFDDDIPSFVDEDGGATTTEKLREKRASLSAFGPKISVEKEHWVARYKNKSLLRKVFDKQEWVQDEGIRRLQAKIAFQSQLWAVVTGIPLVALFVVLPSGNFY
ncbi:MAG: hypothetical protein M1839_004985 [Geoglossum umbratile]|nr:MAG: hypothetical protein M1839_004985 [Geoglossum umbratile]